VNLDIVYQLVFPALWACWLLYWGISAKRVKTTVRRESLGSRLLHIVPLVIALELLWFDRFPPGWLTRPLVPWTPGLFWAGAVVTAGGFLFTVWARVHLGRNWSATVTLKQDHELITTGPYGIVRHPIYTGLLIAIIGSAIARDEVRGVLAVVVAWAALWRKLKLEEKWMVEMFGEKYRAYRARVPALIPGLRRG